MRRQLQPALWAAITALSRRACAWATSLPALWSRCSDASSGERWAARARATPSASSEAPKSRRGSGAAAMPGPWELADLWLASVVQPGGYLGGVEPHEMTDLEVGDSPLGHQPAHVTHRVTQEVGKGLYVDKFRHRCGHIFLRRGNFSYLSRSVEDRKRNTKSQKSSTLGFLG